MATKREPHICVLKETWSPKIEAVSDKTRFTLDEVIAQIKPSIQRSLPYGKPAVKRVKRPVTSKYFSIELPTVSTKASGVCTSSTKPQTLYQTKQIRSGGREWSQENTTGRNDDVNDHPECCRTSTPESEKLAQSTKTRLYEMKLRSHINTETSEEAEAATARTRCGTPDLLEPQSSLLTSPRSEKRKDVMSVPRRSSRITQAFVNERVDLTDPENSLFPSNDPKGVAKWIQSQEGSAFGINSDASDNEPSNHSSSCSEPFEESDVPKKPERRVTRKSAIKSEYFDKDIIEKPETKTRRARRPGRVSCNPFPPLDSSCFGLIQEELAAEPFWVIIVTIFLTLTTGKKAVPVFRQVKERWPTPDLLMHADNVELSDMIKSLGLFKRVKQCKDTARAWVETPPTGEARHRVLNYPQKGTGKDIKPKEVLDKTDLREGAWEIGHITRGPYALDSWRIFCRDIFLQRSDGWKGEGRGSDFEPEWMRVNPGDKELRAILRWMWLKEGFLYNADTGVKIIAGRDLMEAAIEGRIGWDNVTGDLRIVPVEEVDTGDFVPRPGGDCKVIWQRWEKHWESAEADTGRSDHGECCL